MPVSIFSNMIFRSNIGLGDLMRNGARPFYKRLDWKIKTDKKNSKKILTHSNEICSGTYELKDVTT